MSNITEFSSSKTDSDIFKIIINDNLLPIINDIFKSYIEESPYNFLQPTEHLDRELKKKNYGLTLLEQGYNSVYEIGEFPGTDFIITIKVNIRSFSLQIVPKDNIENTPQTNMISFSPQRELGMYIYGIKSNGPGPKITGNTLNETAFLICREMHIRKLYISDSAGVKCYLDPSIELEHFSILRIMVGKPTFYESIKPGHFYDEIKAMEEKQLIYDSITQEEREYILCYLKNMTNKTHSTDCDNCDRLNKIIQKGLNVLDKKPEIFRYVVTPYIHISGGKKKYKHRSKKIKKTKKNKKKLIKRTSKKYSRKYKEK